MTTLNLRVLTLLFLLTYLIQAAIRWLSGDPLSEALASPGSLIFITVPALLLVVLAVQAKHDRE